MEIICSENDETSENITFLYRWVSHLPLIFPLHFETSEFRDWCSFFFANRRCSYRPGLELESHAIHVARLYDLPASVIDRAKYVADLALHHDLARLSLEVNNEPSVNSASTSAAGSFAGDQSSSKIKNPNLLPTAREIKEAESKVRKFLEWDLEVEEDGIEEFDANEALSKIKQTLKVILES